MSNYMYVYVTQTLTHSQEEEKLNTTKAKVTQNTQSQNVGFK